VNKKQKRVDEINELIKLISDIGRRFFYSEKHDRIARFEIQKSGRIAFYDDYSGKKVNIYLKHREWPGFTHGGTLKNLVGNMSEYIRFGHKIDVRFLAPFGWSSERDIWGYGKDASDQLKRKAVNLNCVYDGRNKNEPD